MASFKALNIESDDESDIVVDDTKEIQIEEALKLYQTALRLHAEGPASFDRAAKAYQDLFASEIFHYPESQTELRRIELYGPQVDSELAWEDVSSAEVQTFSGFDTGPSTLPQILHLSHKNFGQFKLEWLAARLDSLQTSVQSILSDASQALDHFVSALDKDDTDADLWRKTAAVGSLLDSKRVARLCLETSLDNDEEGLNAVLNIPGFEDSLANQQLTSLIADLHDHLSSLQPGSTTYEDRKLLRHLRFSIDRFQALVNNVLQHKTSFSTSALQPSTPRILLKPPKTWIELGELLLNMDSEGHEASRAAHHASILQFELGQADTPYLTPPQDSMPDDATYNGQPMTSSALLPQTVDQQFPGLDDGKPAAQIRLQDPVDDNVDAGRPTTATSENETRSGQDISLPTRKRSGDTAGLAENGEEGRSRSKRIRARDSLADPAESKQALQEANVQWEYDQHLKETQAADDWLYETVGPFFARVGVGCFESIKDVKATLTAEPLNTSGDDISSSSTSIVMAQKALYDFLKNFNEKTAQSMLHGADQMETTTTSQQGSKDATDGQPADTTNLHAVAEIPQDVLYDFLDAVNSRNIPLQEIAADFVMFMTVPGLSTNTNDETSPYLAYIWRDGFRSVIDRLIVAFDAVIFKRASDALEQLHVSTTPTHDHQCVRGWVQTMFELHSDIHQTSRRASVDLDVGSIEAEANRLDRWFEILREVNQLERDDDSADASNLDIRLLWSSSFYIKSLASTPRERSLAYLQDLRRTMVNVAQSVKLINHAIMPELSLAALDREISQLTTKDFFDKIAEMEASDPAALIETIEPLLDALEIRATTESEDADDLAAAVPMELIDFLESGNLTNVMQLWRRLLDAYTAIGYKPMVVRTLFRIMRLALSQIEDATMNELVPAERAAAVLTALKLVQRLTANILQMTRSSADALECLDESDLHSAVTLYDKVLRLLQAYNVFEDPIRVGRNQTPTQPNGQTMPSFKLLSETFHDMQLQVWTVLYRLLEEAIDQNDDLFLTPQEDKFDFLRTLHRNLGIRCICGGLNGSFIGMLKDEFFKMSHVDGYDSEQAQVLYDLYGLNCFLNPSYELMEHHCAHNTSLDREVAHDAVDMLLAQAEKLPIKELVKHSLKDAIDKVHGALNRKKPTEAILRNREAIRAFLRSPINPVEIYRCFRGEGNQLLMSPVPEGDAVLAAKGWYYLMGHLALTKFRAMKRTGPTPTEDIDIAIAFFMQELEYSTSRWETWFRLGQAYDTKLEESVAWSSEKLNSSMPEIIQLQRAVIHCYTMSIALVFRSAKPRLSMADDMTELYTEFAVRIYSSSRAPFSMLAFTADVPDRYLSKRQGLDKQLAFKPLTPYAAWKIAKVLFQRAIAGNPQQWTLHYSLAKCLWKMHTSGGDLSGKASLPTAQDVLSAVYRAIELLPGKKDSRDSKRDPVMEPHYKLVSLVNKLVAREELTLDEAKEALAHTHYTRKVDFPDSKDSWTPYILAVLKSLRAADKSNWHHRMIARSAEIIFRDGHEPDELVRSANAKHELTQQLFTKTMVLQVWRPDAERPGRHFVYCARYTNFFVTILDRLEDKANLDQLARRIRRRTHEIFEHSQVWANIVTIYLRLLRSQSGLAEGIELSTFSNILHEEFLQRKEPLEKWMQSQDTGKNVILDVLREVLELKKINQNLMKTGPIDDLIGDTYASLFNTIGKELWEKQRQTELELEQAKPVDPPAPPEPTPPPPRNVMNLANLMNVVEPAPVEVVAEAAAEIEAPIKKKTGVGRREIRSAADASLYKPPSRHGSARHSMSSEQSRRPVVTNMEPDVASGDEREESVAGSIIDDADDESELSELDETGDADTLTGADAAEEEDEHVPSVKPLFPNLATAESSRDEHDSEAEEASGVDQDVAEEDASQGDTTLDSKTENYDEETVTATAAAEEEGEED